MKVRAEIGPAQYADKAGEIVIKRGPRAVMTVLLDKHQLLEIMLNAAALIQQEQKREIKSSKNFPSYGELKGE